jgi:RNA polymerase sigma-70 factor (ECF subfamily)
MNIEQEKELIEKAQIDIQAFGLLYDEYYPKIFGYILVRTAKIDTAQDITSDVFFKALKNIKKFKCREVPFSAWLCRIANHEIANHYRENGHGTVLVERVKETITLQISTPESELKEAEEKLLQYEQFLRVQQKIAQLPIKYQEVIALRFFQNYRLKEISGILGKREETVKTLLYRGLARLKKMVKSQLRQRYQ